MPVPQHLSADRYNFEMSILYSKGSSHGKSLYCFIVHHSKLPLPYVVSVSNGVLYVAGLWE